MLCAQLAQFMPYLSLFVIKLPVMNTHILQKLPISLLLIGGFFLVPLFTLLKGQPIQHFWPQWLTVALGTLASLSFISGQFWQKVHLPQSIFIPLGLMGIVIIQWMLGMLHSNAVSLYAVLYLLWAAAMVLLGQKMRQDIGLGQLVHYLAWFSVAAGMLVSIFMLLGALAGIGITLQASHVMVSLIVSIVSAVHLLVQGKLNVKVAIPMIAVALAGLAYAGGSIGWAIVAAIVLVAIVIQAVAIKHRTGSRQKRDQVRLALALIPAYALIAWAVSRWLGHHLDTPDIGHIAAVWWQGLQLFMGKPLLGVGLGNVAWQSFLAIDAPAINGAVGVYGNTQNMFIQLMAEMGTGAALILVVGYIGWLKNIDWRHPAPDTWWLVTTLVALLCYGFFDAHLQYAYIAGFAALLLGAGDEKTSEVSLPRAGIATSAVLATVLTVNLSASLWSNHQLQKALPLAHKSKLTLEESHLFDTKLEWVHRHSLLAPYAEQVFAETIPVNHHDLKSKIWLNDAVLRFHPTHRVAYKQVVLLELNGEHKAAVQLLKFTLNAYPIKFSQQLALLPMSSWQDYLNVLSEARPPKAAIKRATKTY